VSTTSPAPTSDAAAVPRADLPAPPPNSRITDRWERRILWANLVGQIAIVVTGGAVRLTGSGLGCSTWPQCEPGQFTPVLHEATSWNPLIEFGNRAFSGVVGMLALAAALVVWRHRDRAGSFRALGLVPVLGVVLQAVVGGLTVRLDLHPGWVAGHLLISMVLVAASTALLVRHREGDGAAVPVVGGRARTLGWALVPLLAVVLALGVATTGSGPHSGDDEVGYRFAFDPALVARVHAGAVWLFALGAVALAVLVLRSRAPGGTRHAVGRLLAVTALQGAIGYVQYFTGLPEVLVGAHMLGASLLVVAQVLAVLSLRDRPAP
jgi:cytochrome c oxidase assembly protein subunit 15